MIWMRVCYFGLDPSLPGDEYPGSVLPGHELPACSGHVAGLDSWWSPGSHCWSLETPSRQVAGHRDIQAGCWSSGHHEDGSG